MSLNNDTIIILDVPQGMEPGKMLAPVRADISPLGLLIDRMTRITSPKNISVLVNMEAGGSPYGKFTALRGVFLSRVKETEKLHRLTRAASGRGAAAFVRIDARHVFADPDIARQLGQFRAEKKAAFARADGAPAWLTAEAFESKYLLDASIAAKANGDGDIDPVEALAKYVDGFKPAALKTRIRGRWKADNIALGDPQGEPQIMSAMRSAPDPVSLSYKDFLA
jgi:spore coat polysaccharide biosynthesis protein SpsF (cytidylyltransferase family)